MDQVVTVGRRKTSVARVFFRSPKEAGNGQLIINGRTLDVFFPVDVLQIKVMQPFVLLDIPITDYDIMVNVRGGGITGQAEAIRMAFARALVEINEEHKPALRAAGFVTRDSRMVERKKYGQPKARKKTQFSKR
ncbi:MAG: 30S ribosomal protein S9 [Bacteroidota bacterium]